ncbi:MAG: benzoate/H(+) symporter BenE family transporter [Acetobacteraceae bacterium]|nr:benzoate/H(+) symporter BenE family transporter [Paracoccaceae bacterium]MCU0984959.1 benzoate/H(+) symporter BenE family transporter [Acetobacteraceae bacterium]
MLRGASIQATGAGLLAGLVGFASSFAVVLQGLTAAGADAAQAASGLAVLTAAMGLCGIVLSVATRMPVSVAWSTPGAALLATSGAPDGGFAAAVGAFIAAGVLVIAAGLFRPLGRAVAAIPGPLANAMLGGVLFSLCLAPVRAAAEVPLLALPMLAAWALAGRVSRLAAIPAALAAAVIGVALSVPVGPIGPIVAVPVLVVPAVVPSALLGIALPLFLVTMASQNIPGIAVLSANGYRPSPGPLFTATGIASVAAAPFGSHAVNLAAITAAICAGPGAHPNPERRWWAATVAGATYLVFGILAGGVTGLAALAPPVLVQAVAGLALLGPLAAALVAGLAEPKHREAAIVTFVVSASGLSIAGIGAAFWGLLAGGALMLLARAGR